MQPWPTFPNPFTQATSGTNTTPTSLDDALKQAQNLAQQFWQAQQATGNINTLNQAQSLAPILQGFANLAQSYAQDPQKLTQMQLDIYQSSLALWANMAERALGKETADTITPAKDDRRFASQTWQEHLLFDFIKQSYLLLSKWTLDSITEAQALSTEEKEKLAFYSRQFLDALSPSNFPLTNPDVLTHTIQTNGQNLLDGMKNLLSDLQSGKISMTDYDAFEVGKNLATTPGEVIYRNHLFELIQYTPTTKETYQRPLLICPPWINRYYILDLQPKNSFIKYMVEQGFTVFLISWKNPDASYRDTTFDNYVEQGLLEAVDVTRAISQQEDVNLVGYCIGGTLLAATLAALSKKKDTRIHSATFFTTLVDFQEAGELSVFIDEQQITQLEAKMQERGYLNGRDMATTFSLLRANDLVWSFVVNNYLLGKQPFPFDILYWNDDPTRMPYAMHSWYLRNLYLENNLIEKNKLELLGEKIDLTQIKQPVYMVSALNDHITPWQSCYSPLPFWKGEDKRFVLSKAGHVAGVVNPPTPAGKPVKRAYWAGPATQADAQDWFVKQTQQQDSWWPDYVTWLAEKSGEKAEAPKKAGNTKHKPITPAPGTYVLEQ